MKNIQHQFLTLLFITLALPDFAFAQNYTTDEFSFDVHRSYPYIALTKAQLKEAETLVDLNKHYKPEWVKQYLSVEISASHDGELKKAVSKNNILSQEQKDLLYHSDEATDILVKVSYLPDNSLKDNPVQETDFTFIVEPEQDATYVGGKEALQQYLQQQVMDNISSTSFGAYQLKAVQFTIDETGRVVDPEVFWAGEDEALEKPLLDAVCNMPDWIPAAYADGTKVKQDFVLTVGDMRSCVVNLLNIRQD